VCDRFLAVLGPVSLALALLGGCAPEKQVELKAGEKAIVLTGSVSPVQEAEVASPIAAVVEQVLVEPGKRVRAKEVLVRLDPATFKADVLRAEAALAQARANLAQTRSGSSGAERAEARAEVDRLRYELERQKRLAALPATGTDSEQAGIILENARAKLERAYSLFARRLASRLEIEAAQNEYAEALRRFEASAEALERRSAVGDSETKIAEARYDAARARLAGLEAGGRGGRIETAVAQVRQAEADAARARYNLAQAVVEAPIAGIVVEVKVQAGEKVYERTPLVSIVEISRVQVKADLSPGLLSYVSVGQKAQVIVNTVPPTTVQTTVHRIQPVADPKTQALGVTFILPNPGFKFQPGFTARVEIPVQRAPEAPAKKGGAT